MFLLRFTTPVGNNRSYNNRDHRNNPGASGNYNSRYNKNHQAGPGNGNDRSNREERPHLRGNEQSGPQYNNNVSNQLGMNNKELAPRFKRNFITTNQDSVDNLQMRPAPNSLLFKAASQNHKVPSMLPICTPPNGGHSNGSPLGVVGGVSQNKESQLSNVQYPLLGTPTSHMSTSHQNARPSSTPSAEADFKSSLGSSSNDKGLKNTSSSPNFSSNACNNQRNVGNFENHDDLSENRSIVSGPQASMLTKQGVTEKASVASASAKQQKKEKSFNKEEVLNKTACYIKENFFYAETKDEIINFAESNDETKANLDDNQLGDVVEGFLELKVPEKCMKDVCINMILDVLDKTDELYIDRVFKFLQALKKHMHLKPNLLLEVFKQVVKKMNEREALNPRITTYVAILLAKATLGQEYLLKLSDIANYTDNGLHFPLFLLVLQQLHKIIGKDELEEKFRASNVDIMNCLPESDRNKIRLAEILDDRSLTFLYPLLKVQAEMSKQLAADPDPSNFYKWIKDNVDAKYFKEEGFINALMTVVVKYVTSQTSFPEGTDIKNCPDKATIQKEESLLHKYCKLLKTFLGHSIELQLIAIYALQVFCVNENFPKGRK